MADDTEPFPTLQSHSKQQQQQSSSISSSTSTIWQWMSRKSLPTITRSRKYSLTGGIQPISTSTVTVTAQPSQQQKQQQQQQQQKSPLRRCNSEPPLSFAEKKENQKNKKQETYFTRKYGRSISATLQTTKIQPGNFKVIKTIGKGDVGRVVLAQHTSNGQLYAIKVLVKKEMLARNKVHRVLAEQEMLATIHHPFIVSLHYSFQNPEHIYFCMEYCAGGEFFRMLQQYPNKCLPDEEAARFYAAEVVCALEFLHLMGFVYRDLKPENILLHKSGHIRLTDFDLSKHIDYTPIPKTTRNSKQKSARTNSFVGTEEYLAPEVIKGTGHSNLVDYWTLGILIFEMLYGATPFKGANRHVTFLNVINKDVYWPHTNYSSSSRSLIRKLLAKDSSRRLGARGAWTDVKTHAFFLPINFALLRSMEPPIKPEVSWDGDTRNFRHIEEVPGMHFDFVLQESKPRSADATLTERSQPHSSTVSEVEVASTASPLRSPDDPFGKFDSLSILHLGSYDLPLPAQTKHPPNREQVESQATEQALVAHSTGEAHYSD